MSQTVFNMAATSNSQVTLKNIVYFPGKIFLFKSFRGLLNTDVWLNKVLLGFIQVWLEAETDRKKEEEDNCVTMETGETYFTQTNRIRQFALATYKITATVYHSESSFWTKSNSCNRFPVEVSVPVKPASARWWRQTWIHVGSWLYSTEINPRTTHVKANRLIAFH